jgi:uncharacterized protein (UPF0297 family)
MIKSEIKEKIKKMLSENPNMSILEIILNIDIKNENQQDIVDSLKDVYSDLFEDGKDSLVNMLLTLREETNKLFNNPFVKELLTEKRNTENKSIKKKAMLSQPMRGKTDEEIIETRNRAIKALEAAGYEVVNTPFTDEWYSKEKMEERGVVQIPVCFLAKSIENMSLCHAVYFCKGWDRARGCILENEVAKAYGLDIIYEE